MFDFYYHCSEEALYSSEKLNLKEVPRCSYSRAALLVGVDEHGNGTGLVVGATRMVWATLREGLWEVAWGSRTSRNSDEAYLRVQVEGSTYKAYDQRGELVSAFSGSGQGGGRVGFWLWACNDEPANHPLTTPKFDNFTVTSLD